jgi:hypothetical protein
MTTPNNDKLSATQDRLIATYLDRYAEHKAAEAKLKAIRDEIEKFADVTGLREFENPVAKVCVFEQAGKTTIDKDRVLELVGQEVYDSLLKRGAASTCVKVTITK